MMLLIPLVMIHELSGCGIEIEIAEIRIAPKSQVKIALLAFVKLDIRPNFNRTRI